MVLRSGKDIRDRCLLIILFFCIAGSYAPKPSSGPHKTRECLPLIIFLRNRLKYALNGREVTAILKQRLVKVDHRVRTDSTFPAGFMGKLVLGGERVCVGNVISRLLMARALTNPGYSSSFRYEW